MAVVGCVVWATPAAAMASHRSGGEAPAGHVVLGSSFKLVTAAAPLTSLWTSGGYVLLQNTIPNPSGPSRGWRVINDRTGKTTGLDPRCSALGLGPPWVLLSCPQTSNPSGPPNVELYSLTDGTSRTVEPGPGVPQCSWPPPDSETECSTADAVGADWIRWDATCYHCRDTYFFQNIQTGQVRDDPTNATTFADLSSPALAQKTCPGVRLSPEIGPAPLNWGPLTPHGQYALATDRYNDVVLERCRTHMRRVLFDAATAASYSVGSNAGAIVWQAVTGRLNGLFLPGLQTFTIPLPSRIGLVGTLGLTSRALYVSNQAIGAVWRTVSPVSLPSNTRRPTLTRSASTLTCRRGRWSNARGLSYAWSVNGVMTRATTPRLTVGGARRRTVTCSVTASNAAGATTATSAPRHLN